MVDMQGSCATGVNSPLDPSPKWNTHHQMTLINNIIKSETINVKDCSNKSFFAITSTRYIKDKYKIQL